MKTRNGREKRNEGEREREREREIQVDRERERRVALHAGTALILLRG